MTAYIDYTYYTGTYKGTAISESEFTPISIMASIELDGMTMNRIRNAGLSSYDAGTQDLIKASVCMLADAISETQASTGSTSGMSGVTSESVGGYSYSVDSAARTYDAMMAQTRKRVQIVLLSTGLCSAAVGGSWRPGWL